MFLITIPEKHYLFTNFLQILKFLFQNFVKDRNSMFHVYKNVQLVIFEVRNKSLDTSLQLSKFVLKVYLPKE